MRAPQARAGARTEEGRNPLVWRTTDARGNARARASRRQTSETALSGTVRKTTPAPSRARAGSRKARPRASRAARRAEAKDRLAKATSRPARARARPRAVATAPAPTKATLRSGLLRTGRYGPTPLDGDQVRRQVGEVLPDRGRRRLRLR